jgi:hypothetical protein
VFGDVQSLRPTSLSADILELLYTLEAEDSMRSNEETAPIIGVAA